MEDRSFLKDENWAYLLTMLPSDLEETAQNSKAIQRKREIKSASELLRVILLYCYCGLSLSGVALWWFKAGLGKLSKRAIEMRLKKSAVWLGRLLYQKLSQQTSQLSSGVLGYRVRLVDATVINRPGSKESIDWRIHLGLDLAKTCTDEILLTRGSKGESFKNFEVREGDLMIGDRGYAHREGIAHVVKHQGNVIVRLPWNNVPLENSDGSCFYLLGRLRDLSAGQVGDFQVRTAADSKRTIAPIAGRLVAIPKIPEATEKARREINQQARKKGKTPDARTLEAAGYIFVFTTLTQSQMLAKEVLELYRLRWQIELNFKRLKSILEIDEIPVKDEILCRTYLFAKLLGALLVEELAKHQDFSPWGYGLPTEVLTLQTLQTH